MMIRFNFIKSTIEKTAVKVSLNLHVKSSLF